jgi:uncharacterized protein (TIGR03000 family)
LVIATVALMASAGPAMAQRGYRGGFGGYRYGYRPFYNGYRAYPYSGYFGGYPYNYGNWAYPNYGVGYYPGNDYSSYYTPSTSDPVSGPGTSMAKVPDTMTDSTIRTSAPTNSATGTGASSSGVSVVSGTLSDGMAQISVRVTEVSEVWIDGKLLYATGSVRKFTTPPLAGQKWSYTIRARWLEHGALRDQTKTITVGAGDKIEVSFVNPSDSGEKKDPFGP